MTDKTTSPHETTRNSLKRNVSRTLTCNLLNYWYALPALLFISFSIVYVPMRISDLSKSKTTRDGQ